MIGCHHRRGRFLNHIVSIFFPDLDSNNDAEDILLVGLHSEDV